jgi:hypothetical protein
MSKQNYSSQLQDVDLYMKELADVLKRYQYVASHVGCALTSWHHLAPFRQPAPGPHWWLTQVAMPLRPTACLQENKR